MSMDLKDFFALDDDTAVTNGTAPELIGADFYQRHLGIAVPYLTVLCLATVSGTIGNTMVIGAVMVNKHLKTEGNIFIVNLAIADLCVTGFVDPFSIIGILRGEAWFVGRRHLCEAIASICLTSCFCSLLSIGAISFNRYIHICHNHSYTRIYTRRNSLMMAVGLWVLSFCLEMPNFLGWGDHAYDRKTLSCVWDRTADLSYTMFFSLVGVAFPIILISICYIKIYLFVRSSKNNFRTITGVPSMVTAKQKKERRESMRLARTLFIIFVTFATCWTPYAIIVAADFRDEFLQEWHIFSILLAHTNSSLNCILYGLTNRQFRQGYLKLLRLNNVDWSRWWCHRKKVVFQNQASQTDNDIKLGELRKIDTTQEGLVTNEDICKMELLYEDSVDGEVNFQMSEE